MREPIDTRIYKSWCDLGRSGLKPRRLTLGREDWFDLKLHCYRNLTFATNQDAPPSYNGLLIRLARKARRYVRVLP